MLNFLGTVIPYNTLDERGLHSLAHIAIRRAYRKNIVIIREGDDTNTMFILVEGEMRVYVEDEQGKQLTIRILKPGDSFGQVALIGDFPRTASVMTITDCVVAAFPREKYLSFLEQHPEILLALARTLANMVRDTTAELSNIALSDVYGRVIHILEKYAVKVDDHRLEVEQGLEPALGDLRLVRRVLRVPARVLEDVALDHRRRDAVVVAHPDERTEHLVASGHVLQLDQQLVLAPGLA